MRHGNTAGLLGVIVKVSLCVHVCVVTDDLNGVLVCAYRTVSAKSPELAVDGSLRCGNQSRSCSKRQVCHIIFDTDCESFLLCVIEYCNDLCRCGVFGAQSVTSAVYRYAVKLGSFQCGYNIQVQRLALCSRLFRSVQNVDVFYSIRDSVDQCLCTEWSVQTYFYDTDFFTGCQQVINGLFDGIACGSHCNDNFFSILCSVVVEQLIVGADLCINLVHVFLNDSRHSIVIRIAGLSCLEEDIRILCGTSLAWMIWIQCMISEFIDRIHIYQVFQIFVIPCLDLLNLVGSTESIKEVDKWELAFQSRTMCNRA